MDHPARSIALEAHVAPWVVLGAGCIVHPFAVIGRLPSQLPSLARRCPVVRHIEIGEGTEVGPHAVIYGGAKIGRNCLIGDGANIREGAVIGDNCIIGCHVSVGFDVVLHDNVRVNTGTHLTHETIVGEGTFIGMLVTTASDKRREVVEYEYKGSVAPLIGKGCLIGSGACLLPEVRIGDGAVVGMGALVVRDVPAGATVLGQPARILTATIADLADRMERA